MGETFLVGLVVSMYLSLLTKHMHYAEGSDHCGIFKILQHRAVLVRDSMLCEPIHDLKGHLNNLLPNVPTLLTGELKPMFTILYKNVCIGRILVTPV